MSDARILVAEDDAFIQIRLIGRATFAISQSLRSCALRGLESRRPHIHIDLSECESMDSTIMGVLGMIGLRAKQYGLQVEIVNANDRLKKMLGSLGVGRLFRYTHSTDNRVDWQALCQTEADASATEQTMLDAHETLMELDDENIPRFQDVVDYLKKDLDARKGTP